MSTRRPAAHVGAMVLLVIALAFSSVTAVVIVRQGVQETVWGVPGVIGLWGLSMAISGFLIAWHRSLNPIGWMLLSAGVVASMASSAVEYLNGDDVSSGLGRPLAFLSGTAWILVIGLLSVSILMFPTGRLPSSRWLPVPLWIGLSAALLTASTPSRISRFLEDHPLSDFSAEAMQRVPDPSPVELAINGAYQVALVAGFLSVVGRFRSSAGVERQQLKWLAFAAGVGSSAALVFEVVLPVFQFQSARVIGGQVLSVVILLIPISIGIAILRYRLYEIDRVINRTVVYGAVVVVSVSVYGVGVFVFRELLPVEGDLAVAASTLTVAALRSISTPSPPTG